jgi:hypothetical protein
MGTGVTLSTKSPENLGFKTDEVSLESVFGLGTLVFVYFAKLDQLRWKLKAQRPKTKEPVFKSSQKIE